MIDDIARTLTGELVELEPLVPGHADELWNALDDDVVWKWIPVGRVDRAGFDRFFEFLLGENTARGMVTWVNRLRETGELVGTSSYLAIRREHDGVEIGYTMVASSAWGTGANVEAKLLMMEHGFETVGLQRIEFKTDARNERSRGALAALPAHFEGIFRRHMNTAEGVRDSAYYAVTIDDWPGVKANLKARLEG